MSPLNPRAELGKRARIGRIVIKIGSGVLTDADGRLAHRTVKRLATEIAPLITPRRWPYIVSSGAVAVGMGILGLKERPKAIPGLQAAAAVGQSKLVESWSNAFKKHDVPVAQVLLTHDDLANRRRFLNARGALAELERRGAVAVINENDTVSYEEIAVGDNDGLAAQVSNLVDAGLLILLSTAPGILDENGQVIDVADATDPALDAVIRPERSRFGIGGMKTKIDAARVAAARGAHVAIIEGKRPDAIRALIEGESIGTLLVPAAGPNEPLKSRHHWIAHTLRPAGSLEIDAGARSALVDRKKSLLPKGIVAVLGEFRDGEAVDVCHDGQVVARGLCRYSSAQLAQIAGCESKAIGQRLGFTLGDAVVHRDDLVVLV